MKKLASLRKKYPAFIYQKYSYRLQRGDLMISFSFKAEPDIVFKPRIVIKNIPDGRLEKIDKKALNNLVFHLGLMEIPSYWKATCSPEIIIRAGALDKTQAAWWHDLIMNGMGQFFYENKINYREPDFLKISVNPGIAAPALETLEIDFKNRFLVPFSGGKDSVVTLEKLKAEKEGSPIGLRPREIGLFLVNPTRPTQKTVRVSGVKKQIAVIREIDEKLLVLNKNGYLNGHTPFTGVLSFLSVFGAVLFDYKNIAFSNEKSADEGNATYLGKNINHQWAKSSEFEKMFKGYCRKYLAKNINYCSFLRKHTELQIAKMFVKYPKYFPVFSSCNRGPKTGARWCNNCPKCLFTYLVLSPYLTEKQLLKIFGKNLLKDKKLQPLLKKLTGESGIKPFECVGTKKESRLALRLSLKKE